MPAIYKGGLNYSGGSVTDVQIDSTSIVSSGVANITTMTGAGVSTAGTKGLVPAPASGDNTKFLCGDGSWQTVNEGTTIIANPSGTPIEVLTSIQIGNTIYSLPQGGASSEIVMSTITPISQDNGDEEFSYEIY